MTIKDYRVYHGGLMRCCLARGGVGRNIFCIDCGAGFNVAYPRHVVMGERIGGRPDAALRKLPKLRSMQ